MSISESGRVESGIVENVNVRVKNGNGKVGNEDGLKKTEEGKVENVNGKVCVEEQWAIFRIFECPRAPPQSPAVSRFPSQVSDDSSNFGFSYLKTQQALNDRRESLFKILVIGELGAGKTSIIKRYVHEFFSQNYRATIGVDFALKVLNWDQNTVVRLQLWDIAGQERFGNMTRVYYKEAVGALIVFDVTRAATFDAVLKWKQDLDSKVQLPDGSPIPCILLANKCDQPKEGIVNDKEKMNEYCKQNNFSAWFETSAKENINIDNAAKCLVEKILQNEKFNQKGDSQKDGNRVSLGGRGQGELQDGKKKFCC